MLDQDMSVQKLSDLKAKSPTDLLALAEELAAANASPMRKQAMLYAILNKLPARHVDPVELGAWAVLGEGARGVSSTSSNNDSTVSSTHCSRSFSMAVADSYLLFAVSAQERAMTLLMRLRFHRL